MLIMAMNVSAQTEKGSTAVTSDYNAEAQMLASRNQVFELNRLLDLHADDLDPFVRAFCEAKAYSGLNRNDRAVTAMMTIFNDYLANLDAEPLLGLFVEAASCLEAEYRYADAATVIDHAVGLLENTEGVPAEILGFFNSKAQYYHEMAKFPMMTFDACDSGYDAPMRMDSITVKDKTSVFLNTVGTVNGQQTSMFFDTGAAYSIISPEAAMEFGLKITSARANAEGGGSIAGRYAIADDVTIGSLHLQNVAFFVTPLTASNDTANAVFSKLKCIVGLNVMQKMQEVTLDFDRQCIHFPAQPADYPEPNLTRDTQSKLFRLRAEHDGQPLDMIVDTGCSNFGSLSFDYYQQHKEDYNADSETEVLNVAGLGRTARQTMYVERDFAISVNGKSVSIPKLSVSTEDVATSTVVKSLLGVRSLALMGRVTLSFKDACLVF